MLIGLVFLTVAVVGARPYSIDNRPMPLLTGCKRLDNRPMPRPMLFPNATYCSCGSLVLVCDKGANRGGGGGFPRAWRSVSIVVLDTAPHASNARRAQYTPIRRWCHTVREASRQSGDTVPFVVLVPLVPKSASFSPCLKFATYLE